MKENNQNKMPNVPITKEYKEGDLYDVPYEGSLGLLALGHVGLRLWREKRRKIDDNKKFNPKKRKAQKKG